MRHQLTVKSAALQSCYDGFATGTNLNALAHAEIEFGSPPPAKKPALKAWRAEQAAAEQVEHYRILHQRILLRIAAQLPDTPDALRQIKGVGKATVEKYGAQVAGLVSDYCREQAIEPLRLPAGPARKNREKRDTKQISYELFLQGKGIPEIADARGLAKSTIEGHLAHFVGLGELDINDIVPRKK